MDFEWFASLVNRIRNTFRNTLYSLVELQNKVRKHVNLKWQLWRLFTNNRQTCVPCAKNDFYRNVKLIMMIKSSVTKCFFSRVEKRFYGKMSLQGNKRNYFPYNIIIKDRMSKKLINKPEDFKNLLNWFKFWNWIVLYKTSKGSQMFYQTFQCVWYSTFFSSKIFVFTQVWDKVMSENVIPN